MLKKTLYVFISIILVVAVAQAKKNKTAKIKDNIAIDLKYGWQIKVRDNWKAKSLREPSVERLFMEKKNYLVNPYVDMYDAEYTIPRAMIYVQEFSGSEKDFEALIKISLLEHRSDNAIIRKMGLLRDSEFIISGDVLIDTIHALQALQVYVKRTYERVLVIPDRSGFGSPREQYINDHEVHEIYIMKKENLIYVFQAYCEREFYESNADEFQSMIRTFEISPEPISGAAE